MREIPKRRVNDPQYSDCSSAYLEDLDWDEWWTDSWDGKGITHIKVPHKGHDGMEGTVHRVYPSHATHSRIHFKDGELYWIVDKGETE